MLTVEEIKGIIEQAEKQKQELQELIDSLSTMEVEPGRAAKSERYWYISDVGMLRFTTDERCVSDDYRYECGNYYLTEEDASRSKKQILLFRLLDRFSRQNGWTDDLWEDNKTDKWYIYFSYFSGNVCTTSKTCHRDICQVYFTSESVAQQAVEEYHDLIMEVMAI
jgi:hypothetical protein